MATNVIITKSKLDRLANKINTKAGTSGAKTIDQLCDTVDGMPTGSGTSVSVSWHQCPELPRKFVEEVTYDPADYSVSSIGDYAPATTVVSNYKPIGKTVGDKTFYNEVPNVETPFADGDMFGTVKPLDQVRYINTPYAPNVRDLGGWKCDGGTVKYGLLFRGGEPTVNDRSVLVDELGVRHDLNLRGSTEATWDVSPLGDDVYFTKADAYNWYSLANAEAWKINLRCVFDAVTHHEPVYFHCAAGADRTGTLACVLEGLLGMSQSDIDKDYELTCFYSGTATDSEARRRNEAEWQGLINAIEAKGGATFRDKCLTFAAELGFTADEINAYRAAMINGTPETVTPTISQITVTNTLDYGIYSDNAETSVAQYQPYEANLQCTNGYVIGAVKVTMGGINITGQVWNGKKTNLYRGVQLNLSNCSVSSNKRMVIDGQCYATYITADSGHTLNGAAVSIMMGGNDVSNYYSDGVIVIPKVTGDIVITVTALKSVPGFTNLFNVSGSGFAKESDTKFYTNWMQYNYADNDGNGTLYHIKGVIPYKMRFASDSSGTGASSLFYCKDANIKPVTSSNYDENVQVVQHRTGIGYNYVQFEVREALPELLIITANEEILVDD